VNKKETVEMKKVMYIIILLFLLSPIVNVQAQYTWIDSLAVGPIAVDTTFTYRWIGCTFWFYDCPGWFRFASSVSDTVGWSSKQWIRIEEHQSFDIWPDMRYFNNALYRLEYKTVAGDTGVLFISGLKTQYK
jgi:hypothetical protein